jgi:Glycosyltransferase family 87
MRAITGHVADARRWTRQADRPRIDGVQRSVDRSHLPGGTTITLAVLAAGPAVAAWCIAVAIQLPDLYNDFHSYWYAGRLLAEGASPYDLEALRDLATRHGDVFILGTGYSYLLPFAMALVPLAALPFDVALVLFNAVSVTLFGATIAIWLRRFHPSAPSRRLLLAALLCGAYPPVIGSVLNGQANLVVAAVLGVGVVLAFDRAQARSALGGVAIGLAAVVKLVPAVLVVPLVLAGNRRGSALGVVGGFVVPLGLAALIRPGISMDAPWLTALIRPDSFVTNQSINGFVTRLVESSSRMTALTPGAFDPGPVIAAATLGLAAWTLAVLWRARRRLASVDGLALALALALAAATAGALKTSFWNEALLLVAAGLLLATTTPDLGAGALAPAEQLGLVAWLASAVLQPLVWIPGPMPPGLAAATIVILGSLGLYGNLVLCWLLGRRLLRPAGTTRVATTDLGFSASSAGTLR